MAQEHRFAVDITPEEAFERLRGQTVQDSYLTSRADANAPLWERFHLSIERDEFKIREVMLKGATVRSTWLRPIVLRGCIEAAPGGSWVVYRDPSLWPGRAKIILAMVVTAVVAIGFMVPQVFTDPGALNLPEVLVPWLGVVALGLLFRYRIVHERAMVAEFGQLLDRAFPDRRDVTGQRVKV